MFLLRCAFWLTLAFIIIAPSAELRDRATATATQAVAVGTAQVAKGVESIPCDSWECVTGKAVATVALNSVVPPLPEELPAAGKLVTVTMPVPRPADLI
ncbi:MULTISPECIES: hypothetical protein [unclassified Devosia]|uniref:hypothetical protein n=1 Tax=unclassified Devosia TaxID=196773 RepID=UPI00145D7563|nr:MULTISPECIES: hypothetical protein [unclassified Devosia]MBJ6988187.1 hypothetical protein [Devosia sp. MC521]QMW63466.1 hypothetical protein H4N61_03785 [Devosia sp. MC521]